MYVLAVLSDYANPDGSGATEFIGEKLPYSSHDLPKFIQTVLTELWPKRFSKRQRVFGIFPASGGGEFAALLIPCHDYGDGLARVLVIEQHFKLSVWALQQDDTWKDEGPPIGLRVMNVSLHSGQHPMSGANRYRRLAMNDPAAFTQVQDSGLTTEERERLKLSVEEQYRGVPRYDPLTLPPDAALPLGIFGNGPSEIPNGLRELQSIGPGDVGELDDALGLPKNMASSPSQVATLVSESVSNAVVETVRTPDPEPVESSLSNDSSIDSGGGSDGGGTSD